MALGAVEQRSRSHNHPHETFFWGCLGLCHKGETIQGSGMFLSLICSSEITKVGNSSNGAMESGPQGT